MEEKEFRQKILPLQNTMYAMALKSGLLPDDAADTVQEALLRLWRAREMLPDIPGEQRAYCLKTFRNVLLSSVTSGNYLNLLKKKVPIDSPGVDEAASADSGEKQEETISDLEYLIDTLPDKQRIVIRLSGFAGLETEEIAQATGFTNANVRQLLSRGRRKLRELLNRNK